MERQHLVAGTPEIKVPIRVRGMSHEDKYFDEQTTTTRVTPEFIVLRLRERLNLETEIHITNMRVMVGGTFRVAWNGRTMEDGLRYVGLELVDPDGQIWEVDSVSNGAANLEELPRVVLECRRCLSKTSVQLTEVEPAALGEGFILSRNCEACKATTDWAFYVEKAASSEIVTDAEVVFEAAISPSNSPSLRQGIPIKENREKGRAPIKMGIKIIRSRYGMASNDVCETINVSRTGVFFSTAQGYDPGEVVNVILPYHPGMMEIPVKARVVRLEDGPGTYQKRVAIQILSGTVPGH
jgi:hypothetical protein